MEDYEREQREEMLNQVHRYEKSKLTGEKAWFDSDNYIDIIDWYTNNNLQDKADNVTLEAYKLFPENEDIISRYTIYLAGKGEYDTAINLTKQLLKENKDDDLLVDLATLYIDSGKNYDEALNILLDVITRDNENYFLLMLIGRIYLDKEDLVNAELYFRNAIKINCNDKMLVGCYTDCSYDESLQDVMLRFLYNLTEENPFNDVLWTALGIVYSRYNFLDEAIEAFDYAIAINPKGEIRHSCKADCLITKNELEKAKEELTIALKYSEDDTVELHLVFASILMHQNNYAEALLHLSNVHNRKAEFSDRTYLLDLALCLYCTNRQTEARNIIQEAVKEQVPYELIVDFARRLYDREFYQQSEDIFEQLITEDTDAYCIELASVTLAALKSREGKTFEAVKIMEQTLEELHNCTEDFWYAFLRITCQDKTYNNYTTNTLKLLMNLESFPTYIKEHYPEIFDNPNYKTCLKKIYHV